jgi:hypothetical protein
MATIANQQWISIRNIIIYLETKFRPNWEIFVFWQLFWIQNGRHSKRSIFVNSPPPKPEVILTNFFAEPTVLLVPITSRVLAC